MEVAFKLAIFDGKIPSKSLVTKSSFVICDVIGAGVEVFRHFDEYHTIKTMQ